MKKLIPVILLSLCSFINAQSEVNSFISHLYSLGSSSEKEAEVDSFMNYASSKGIPFVEENKAYFLYHGSADNISLAGDFTAWQPDIDLSSVSGANFWYKAIEFESNARVDYKLIVDGQWILDPNNTNTVPGGYGVNSELAMPEYVQPWEIVNNPNVDQGKIIRENFYSTNLSQNYRIDIYLPPNYTKDKTYPSIYIHDGSDYLDLASSKNIIENLLDSNKIAPFIGIFVTPNDRNNELGFAKRNNYSKFIVNELVPYIDDNYSTSKQKEDRAIMGTSLGGNISAYIVYNFPDVFSKCGLHSAAFWVNNYEVYSFFLESEKIDVDFHSIWGTYENVYSYMRTFRDTLIAKGYQFNWAEYPEGHSWGLWRATLDDILIDFFPNDFTSINNDETLIEDFNLKQNFPNPFNPATTINFTLKQKEKVKLKIFDSLGNEIQTLINKQKSAGEHEISFNAENLSSGVYFYTLELENFSQTKKMVLLK